MPGGRHGPSSRRYAPSTRGGFGGSGRGGTPRQRKSRSTEVERRWRSSAGARGQSTGSLGQRRSFDSGMASLHVHSHPHDNSHGHSHSHGGGAVEPRDDHGGGAPPR